MLLLHTALVILQLFFFFSSENLKLERKEMSSSVNYYFLAVLNELHRGKEKTGKPKVKGNWANNTDRSAPLLSSLPGQLPLDIGLSDFAVSAYVIASWACGVTRGPIRIVLFVLS